MASGYVRHRDQERKRVSLSPDLLPKDHRIAKSESRYTGDLMLFIHSNFTLRINNDELVVPITSIDLNGHRFLRNSTYSQLMINGVAEYPIPILGTAFLTNAYFYVDYDRQEFTLWEGSHQSAQDLVATKPYNCLPLGPQGHTDAILSPGGIAGVVIGSVVIIALLIGLAWFFLIRRRRRQRNHHQQQHNPALEAMRGWGKSSSDGQTPERDPNISKPELHAADKEAPQELSPDYSSEMPSEDHAMHEMPSENHPHSTAQPFEMSGMPRAS